MKPMAFALSRGASESDRGGGEEGERWVRVAC